MRARSADPARAVRAGDRGRLAGRCPGLAAHGRPTRRRWSGWAAADEPALRAALQAFEDLGARATAAAARRRMRQLGFTAIPRGPRAASRTHRPATAREQQVLALIAEGLPDREISRRLFISERTVHHHVSAILAKIGVSSAGPRPAKPPGSASAPRPRRRVRGTARRAVAGGPVRLAPGAGFTGYAVPPPGPGARSSSLMSPALISSRKAG